MSVEEKRALFSKLMGMRYVMCYIGDVSVELHPTQLRTLIFGSADIDWRFHPDGSMATGRQSAMCSQTVFDPKVVETSC